MRAGGLTYLVYLPKLLGFAFLVCVLTAIGLDLTENDISPLLWRFMFGFGFTGVLAVIVSGGALVFVLRRVVGALFVLWFVATLTFVMLRFLPGGPFDEEKALPPEIKANIEAHYGLNKPISIQYVNYMGGLLKGDLGESYKYIGRPVSQILSESLPISFQLGFYALLLAYAIGIPIGVFAASKHNSCADNALMITAISGVALPSFIVGPLLVMIFCFGVPLPALKGLLPPALWESPEHYVLPVVTLGLRPAAIIARMTRSSLLEVKNSDFIRTARAKGVSRFLILYKHALKNSLIPVLTLSGPLIAGVLSGSFVVEIIFGIPGMGKHLVQSVTNRDYPLIMGATLVFAVLLVASNLAVDLLYTVVDPRIRIGEGK